MYFTREKGELIGEELGIPNGDNNDREANLRCLFTFFLIEHLMKSSA